MDVPMQLSRILISERSDQQMIFLKETDGERTFPILIGTSEALAIDRRLKGHEVPRPMTHDLLADAIEQLGGRLTKIVISDLQTHTFIATLHIETARRSLEIDARPSDAIALGVAFSTPLFVAEQVLEKVLRGPATKEERVAMLHDRLEMLDCQIADLSDKLADEEFAAMHSIEMLSELRAHLSAMTAERTAIWQALDKLT